MSNTGDFFQNIIDSSRGKTGVGSKVRAGKHGTPSAIRRKTQILFERNDQLLKDVGGSTADKTPVRGFGPRKQKRFIERGGKSKKAAKRKKILDAAAGGTGIFQGLLR